jgi:hypothetical protein
MIRDQRRGESERVCVTVAIKHMGALQGLDSVSKASPPLQVLTALIQVTGLRADLPLFEPGEELIHGVDSPHNCRDPDQELGSSERHQHFTP